MKGEVVRMEQKVPDWTRRGKNQEIWKFEDVMGSGLVNKSPT